MWIIADAIQTKCSKNFSAMSTYERSSSASSSEICSIVCAKNAIHAVPSACSR